MADTPSTGTQASAPVPAPDAGAPEFRPGERFWPYAQLEEEPSDEELARLDGDLREALLEHPPARPFSFTIVFAPFTGPVYRQAVDLARATSDYAETGAGPSLRHRARFTADRAAALHRLWELIDRETAAEVLVDDRPVPYARELWLPLLWYLLSR